MQNPSSELFTQQLVNKPKLTFYTLSKKICPQLEQWLADFSWNLCGSLSGLRQPLLAKDSQFLMVDLRNSDTALLAQIHFLHEHFPHLLIATLVDENLLNLGQESLKFGADLYVTLDHCSGHGLYMQLYSAAIRKGQSTLAVMVNEPKSACISEALFLDRLTHALMVAARHHSFTGLLLVGLNNHHSLYQAEEQANSCELIRQMAQGIGEVIRSSDSLAHLGLGVFAVLLEELQDEVMVAHIAQKIQQLFTTPHTINDRQTSLSVSIGGHLCLADQLSAAAMHMQASIALQRAQKNSNMAVCFFEQHLNFKTMARSNMEAGLNTALSEQQLLLQYQPLHGSNGFKVLGMESNIRWQHPASGIVMPDIFMGLLESSGLIIDVGKWWLQQSLSQFKEWQSQGCIDARQQIFVPVSEKQLRHAEFIKMLVRELALNSLSTEKVVLSINEDCAVKNIDTIQNINKHIPGICLAVCLCDFSKGYSSLSYLKEIDVDYLCFDDGFFQHIHTDHTKMSVAKIVIDIAHDLGIEVMAKGVESQLKIDKMQSLEIDYLQGEFFSAPLYPDRWPEYVRQVAS